MNTRLSTVNIVVGGLVLITLAMLALVGIIAVDDSPAAVPEGLWTLLGGSIGALAALLARPSGTTQENPTPVTVVPSTTTTNTTYSSSLVPTGTPQPSDPNVR